MHSTSYLRLTLLGATSALAICLAAPSISAQTTQIPASQTRAPMTTQPDATSGSQQDLQQSIQSLEQARAQFSSAKQGQRTNAQTQVQQALQQVEVKLNQMPPDRRAEVSKSIDAAQATLQKPNANPSKVTQALDRVIADIQTLHRQVGQAGQPGGQKQAAGSADIQVDQKSAQVSVQQPAPQVTVTQPPPRVTVQQPQPQVTVQQPQPKVSVDQAKPNVTVQQQGEPRVTVQDTGKPQVSVTKGQQAQDTTSPPPSGTTQGQLATMGRDIVGKDLYGSGNRNMGEVEDVVMGADGRLESVLVDVGGFLGIGARRVAIPISQIQIGQGDRLTTTMTEAEAKALPEYK